MLGLKLYLKEGIGVGKAVAYVDEEMFLVCWLLSLLHKGGVLHQPNPDQTEDVYLKS